MQIVRRHALEQGRGGQVERNVVGNRNALGRGHRTFLGVPAGAKCDGDSVADRQLVNAFAKCRNRTGRLGARYEWQIHWIEAASLIRIDEVDPGRRDVDQHLARRWNGIVELDELENI